MFIGEVLGFWLMTGVAFFGWRRLRNSKEARVACVVPRARGQQQLTGRAGCALPAGEVAWRKLWPGKCISTAQQRRSSPSAEWSSGPATNGRTATWR